MLERVDPTACRLGSIPLPRRRNFTNVHHVCLEADRDVVLRVSPCIQRGFLGGEGRRDDKETVPFGVRILLQNLLRIHLRPLSERGFVFISLLHDRLGTHQNGAVIRSAAVCVKDGGFSWDSRWTASLSLSAPTERTYWKGEAQDLRYSRCSGVQIHMSIFD